MSVLKLPLSFPDLFDEGRRKFRVEVPLIKTCSFFKTRKKRKLVQKRAFPV